MSQLFERRMIMSNAKRRDNKGRVLQMGENQLDDGRYAYRYTTHLVRGKRFTVGV